MRFPVFPEVQTGCKNRDRTSKYKFLVGSYRDKFLNQKG